MRYLIIIFTFSFLGAVAQAQPSALANSTLTPDTSGAAKLKAATPEIGATASQFIGDAPVRRTVSTGVSKAAAPAENEPGSWRMLAAAVIFMFVIALRRQGSGRP